MTVAEAIREYVNETEGLEFYEQEPEKGLGILVKGDNSYMETIMNLTKYFDDHNVDDVNLELEGMYVECQGDDVIVFFPNIEALRIDPGWLQTEIENGELNSEKTYFVHRRFQYPRALHRSVGECRPRQQI